MPQVSSRQNKRLYIEQSILNNFPPESKARWFRYSNASQVVHPFGASIHELAVAQERFWHNYFPSTYDVTDLDLVYFAPTIFTDVEIDGYYDSTSFIRLTKTEADLDAFWYEPLPTRLSLKSTSQKQIYPTNQARQLRFGSMYNEYIFGTHIQNSLFNTSTSTPWTVTSGFAQVAYSTNSGWGGGSVLDVAYTSSPTTTSEIQATSTAISTGQTIAFLGQFRSTGTNITSNVVTIGYQGVGSAQGTFVADQQWQQQEFFYTPPASTSTGIPFVNISSVKNPASTDTLQVSDFSLFDYSSIHQDTSLSYPLRNWVDHDLSWAYVTVSGGTNLMDVDTSVTRPSMPAAVTIEGIDANGFKSTERVLIPYNGTHRSLKLWKDITGTRVDSIYPWTANVSVQLQNYQSSSGQQDTVDGYITSYHDGPLFYSLLSTNGTSYIGHDSFLVDDFTAMVGGFDSILPRYYMELTDTNGSSVSLSDMKIDLINRYIYTLDSANKRILIHDPFSHWPDQTAFQLMRNNSTPYPNMMIQELDEDEYIMRIGDSVGLEALWRNRYKRLLQNRWSLYKPDGTLVGLDLNGNEVSSTSDYWIVNEESTDSETGEFRFKPQNIQYSATNYGDYVATLESQYVDDEYNEVLTEKNSIIFSVPNRTSLKALSLPTTESRVPVGMDLDPNGNIKIAYSNPSNSSILDEETYELHYDYFFEETSKQRVYLRENYNQIKIRRRATVACQFAKTITIIDNTDTVLTKEQCDNGLILVLSNSSVVNVTLPVVTSTDKGLSCIIKRRGSNQVNVLPGAGATVEELTTLPISITNDAKRLTYINNTSPAISDWVLT